MSRGGAKRADIDIGLMYDDKVVKLARLQKDAALTLSTMALYVAAVLASWAANRPLTLVEGAPAWMLDDPTPWIADLITVGLLDDDGRVPSATLDEWMSRARAAIAAGQEGAARRWGGSRAPNAMALPNQPSIHPRQARTRARETTAEIASEPGKPAGPIEPFGSIMERVGLRRDAIGKKPRLVPGGSES